MSQMQHLELMPTPTHWRFTQAMPGDPFWRVIMCESVSRKKCEQEMQRRIAVGIGRRHLVKLLFEDA